MKTRKYGTRAVTALAMVVTALLVINCMNPTNPNVRAPGRATGSQSPGMGVIRLQHPLHDPHTFLPGVPTIAEQWFSVELTATTGGTTQAEAPVGTQGNLDDGVIEVVPGTYTVTVRGFLDAARTQFVTRYVRTGVVVAADANVAITAAMNVLPPLPYDDPRLAVGTLAWTITPPTGINNAEDTFSMIIQPLQSQDLPAGATGIIDLTTISNLTNAGLPGFQAGYHRIVITTTRDGDTLASPPVEFEAGRNSAILHISQHATTTATMTMPDFVQVPWYTVTFQNYNAAGPAATQSLYARHSSLLTDHDAFNNDAALHTPTPATGTSTFLRWERNLPAPVITWDPGINRFHMPTTLHGIWSIPATITITLEQGTVEDALLALNETITLQRSVVTAGTAQPLTINFPSGWDDPADTTTNTFTDIVWRTVNEGGRGVLDGWIPDPDTANHPNMVVLSTTGVLNIPNLAATNLFSAVGNRIIEVEARGSSNLLYSARIQINTTP